MGEKIAHEIAIKSAREETKAAIAAFAIIGLIIAWLVGNSLFSGATVGVLFGVTLVFFI